MARMNTAFISPLERHHPSTLGRDLGIHDFNKKIKDATDHFSNSGTQNLFVHGHTVISNLEKLHQGIKFTNNVYTALTNNGHDSAINGNATTVPMLYTGNTKSLGSTGAQYIKIRTHIGKKTSSRIIKLSDGPNIIKSTKCLCDSLSDYTSTLKRQLLNAKCGFNEKGFSFFMEDTYMSIDDYYRLFKIDKRFKKTLKENIDGETDIYGCVYKTHNKIKLRNRMDLYSTNVKIHLIKIMDIKSNYRDIIYELTHQEGNTDVLGLSGKIPIDFQYSTPDIKNNENKVVINFTASLAASINQSTRFKERARIIRTWTRTLPAGSILEFHLTTHLGRGIHLNKIYNEYQDFESLKQDLSKIEAAEKVKDFEYNVTNITSAASVGKQAKDLLRLIKNFSKEKGKLTNEHPASYVLALEFVGDRRGSIKRNKDDAIFEGYSPCNLSIEFETYIKYLNEDEDPDKLLVYKRVKRHRNFEEDSPFNAIFCPDRTDRMHVDIDNINLGKVKKGKDYTLIYDQSVTGQADVPGAMEDLKKILKDIAFEGTANPEDLNLNTKKPPSETKEEE